MTGMELVFFSVVAPNLIGWVPTAFAGSVVLWGLVNFVWKTGHSEYVSMKVNGNRQLVCSMPGGMPNLPPLPDEMAEVLERAAHSYHQAEIMAEAKDYLDRFEEAMNQGDHSKIPKSLRPMFRQWCEYQKKTTREAAKRERRARKHP